MPFLIIFIILPLLEIMVFASVGEEIGLMNTLLLALITAIIGGILVKRQGLQTLAAMRQSMDKGQMPVGELFDGFCLVVSGATLITPGFITDTIGFLLLIPPFRAAIKHFFKTHTNMDMPQQNFHSQHTPIDPNAIEGEYERVDEHNVDEDAPPR
mgnify:CR=1 FL=1